MKNQHSDTLIRFMFENTPIRGEIVSLDKAYQEILQRHDYTAEVQRYLGEALVCASLLGAILKHQGNLILQTQSDGSLSLLLAQSNSKGEIRGLAKWEGEVSAEFKKAVGKGHLAITIDPGTGKERYQGIVDLKGENLAGVVENYFYQSEQLPTHLFFCANQDRAAGILLQLMPEANDQTAKEYWEHISYLVQTLTAEELLSVDMETILHRLFHQEKLNILASQALKFICRCSRDAMAKSILTLGRKDALNILAEKPLISVTCEFCYKQLDFDRIDVERIFAQSSSGDDRILQ